MGLSRIGSRREDDERLGCEIVSLYKYKIYSLLSSYHMSTTGTISGLTLQV